MSSSDGTEPAHTAVAGPRHHSATAGARVPTGAHDGHHGDLASPQPGSAPDHHGAGSATAPHGQGGHTGHDKPAGHDPEMFRRTFWLSLALTVPIVATSHMVMDWFGYTLDFPGMSWVGPVLGTVVFCYGGWPFLAGGVREVRDRAPGMMLLISMAITVAYVASLATSLGAFDLDFWWELAALVAIMLARRTRSVVRRCCGNCTQSPRPIWPAPPTAGLGAALRSCT
jgi:Cu2+-exporting ATPase